jgi:hypothetical protein
LRILLVLSLLVTACGLGKSTGDSPVNDAGVQSDGNDESTGVDVTGLTPIQKIGIAECKKYVLCGNEAFGPETNCTKDLADALNGRSSDRSCTQREANECVAAIQQGSCSSSMFGTNLDAGVCNIEGCKSDCLLYNWLNWNHDPAVYAQDAGNCK